MNNRNTLRIDEILPQFSQEASPLIASYMKSLGDTMITYNVDNEDEELVFNGIFDYIEEYSNEKHYPLSFSNTLELIEQLGSPSEILRSFNLSEQVIDPLTESTTDNIDSIPSSSSPLMSAFYNNPYTFGMFATYIVLLLLSIICEIGRGATQSLSDTILDNLLLLIIPSFIIGIIIGYIGEEAGKEGNTLEAKYRGITSDYEKFPIYIMSITYIISGPTIGGLAIIFRNHQWYIITILVLLYAVVAGTVPMIYVMSTRNKPKPGSIPYLTLLRYRSQVEEDGKSRIKQTYSIMIIVSIIISIIWVIILINIEPLGFVLQIVTTLLIGIMAFIFTLCAITLREFSWGIILKNIKKFE